VKVREPLAPPLVNLEMEIVMLVGARVPREFFEAGGTPRFSSAATLVNNCCHGIVILSSWVNFNCTGI
jgi:hypothetical protein